MKFVELQYITYHHQKAAFIRVFVEYFDMEILHDPTWSGYHWKGLSMVYRNSGELL